MKRVRRYTWRQFDRDVRVITQRLRRTQKRFDGVWGPPRGGLALAVVLSHALGIPFCTRPRSRRTLIVDDIVDTGKTLRAFAGTHTLVTIFYHRKSIVEPDVWVSEKKKLWILFPWEKSR
ncbi:MAG: hypothetical protein A2991_02780 [Candidatus Terrybacteria bacterium RIFCSPLOWO2_01_FULL_58_14]|uniref:Phosphoribosyltransferase domain-containing protein n=2 Tax=Candidatus Terryibacteriota TaxID=1817920 RepID=A0A1G2Q0Q9_9BACT|nr:MAG: hypothetical protein A2682_00140 [Candidatus Terrybacteria bacterium RIFCSPHIGHO2_01_FULL_58_15]OHA54166.1 MAG: hypothetical protein A2991_02780 [Candidatus Terrybacteria bacterium RIFCSPLOWO2_01_FULL_58_14]